MKKTFLNHAILSSYISRTSISGGDYSSFPKVVQSYFEHIFPETFEQIFFAKLTHSGEFRTGVSQPWFPITGMYYYLSDIPAFYREGKIKPLPILSIKARDFYYKGTGEVRIRLNSIIPMGTSKGPECNSASLLRYLSEMPLIPTVFLTSQNITWKEIDSSSAQITIRDKDLEEKGVFTFNDKGEIIKFEAEQRARGIKKGFSMDKWGGYFSNYKEFNGFKVPTEFVAEWNLPEGDFEYAKFKVDTLEYNKIS